MTGMEPFSKSIFAGASFTHASIFSVHRQLVDGERKLSSLPNKLLRETRRRN